MRNARKGFSLVEVLVTAFIFAFIIAGVFAIFNIASISWHTSLGLLDVQQGARLAMDGMTRELRQLKREPGRDLTVAGSSISFYMPGVTAPIRYYLQGNQIIREHPVNVLKVLANNITSLNFCCWLSACTADCSASDVIQITVSAGKLVRGSPVSFSLVEKVRLRNEQ